MKLNLPLIYAAIAEKKLTLKGLSTASGVSVATISKLRSGSGEFSLVTIGRIAEALDLQTADIVSEW